MMACIAIVVSLLALATTMSSASLIGARIIGGSEVDIRFFPYIVSIRLNDQHICGGSILSTNAILTAAHCMNNIKSTAVIAVRVGSSVHAKGELYKAATIFIHEAYNPRTMQNDIALIKLERPLTYGPTVKRIVLASQRPHPGTPVVVIGWGMYNPGSTISGTLRAVAVPIVPSTICDERYANVQLKITKEMICAANQDASKSSCPGDSGGPLLDAASGNLLGIVSFGQGCGVPAPAVYASVPDLKPWVMGVCRQFDCGKDFS